MSHVRADLAGARPMKADDESPGTLAATRRELRETQERLSRVAAQLADARARAELAERAARESWRYTRLLLHGPGPKA